MNNWLKDFIELIIMEHTASALQEHYRDTDLHGAWSLNNIIYY